MGSVELMSDEFQVHSHLVFYGNAVSATIAEQMRDEIETMWNEPAFRMPFNDTMVSFSFRITAEIRQQIDPVEVYANLDPANNYFRIEEFALGNISFVDGLGCNSGYFKLENLYKGSTTAAHEYGHTLGLDHPHVLDIRGQGVPGIMYPRGTLVDPQYQYDPSKPAGVTGGTMHPMYRKVRAVDIEALAIHRLDFINNKAILGEFTNIFHTDHADEPGR